MNFRSQKPSNATQAGEMKSLCHAWCIVSASRTSAEPWVQVRALHMRLSASSSSTCSACAVPFVALQGGSNTK